MSYFTAIEDLTEPTIPFEDINIGSAAPTDTGTCIYYECIPENNYVKWAYIITRNNEEYLHEAGVSSGNVNYVELETALNALKKLPDNTESVDIYTSCIFLPRYISGRISKKTHGTPKRLNTLFNELHTWISNVDIRCYNRSGSWGDNFADKCCQLLPLINK